MEDRRGAYGVWVGKSEGKRSLGQRRHRWEDNIRKVKRYWTGLIWLRTGTISGLF